MVPMSHLVQPSVPLIYSLSVSANAVPDCYELDSNINAVDWKKFQKEDPIITEVMSHVEVRSKPVSLIGVPEEAKLILCEFVKL